MKGLIQILDAIQPFEVLTNYIELKCQGGESDQCEKFITYDRNDEPIEINDLAGEACRHHQWSDEKMICPSCAEAAAEEDAQHYYEENLFESQREGDAA